MNSYSSFWLVIVIGFSFGVCAYLFLDTWASELTDNVNVFIQNKIGRSSLFLAKSLAITAWLCLGINMFLIHKDSVETATKFFAYGFWLCISIIAGELAVQYPFQMLDKIIGLLKICRWSVLAISIIVAGIWENSYLNDSFAIMMTAVQLAVLYLAVPVKQRGIKTSSCSSRLII